MTALYIISKKNKYEMINTGKSVLKRLSIKDCSFSDYLEQVFTIIDNKLRINGWMHLTGTFARGKIDDYLNSNDSALLNRFFVGLIDTERRNVLDANRSL